MLQKRRLPHVKKGRLVVQSSVTLETFTPWSVADSVPPLESHLEPLRTQEEFRWIADDPEWQELERLGCERDPWYWIVNYCVTEDSLWVSKGLETAYQAFPPLPYLRSVTQVLWEYAIAALPKSRQQRITWLVAAMVLGKAIFQEGRLYMIQSKLGRDSVAVLHRQLGMYRRMREFAPWLGPKIVSETTGGDTGHVTFSNGSTIMAVPEGPHYVQSYTPAWLVMDEVQLQASAQEAFYQALPACENITLIGSAEYSWFCQTLLPDKAA